MRSALYIVPILALVVAVLLLTREMWLIGIPLLVAAIALTFALRQQDKIRKGGSDHAG